MQINQGGLMRCCIKTLQDRPTTSGYQVEGSIIECDYCSASMKLSNGVWEWNRPINLLPRTPQQDRD